MEDRRASGGLLWSRALVLSAVGWTTGSLAHLGADGRLPGAAAMLVLLLLGTALGVPLLRRPASALRTCALVVLGQQAVHLALALTAGHAGHPAVPLTRPHAFLHALPHAVADPLEEPGMLAAHLVAALVCGWWLARGERALWLLLGAIGTIGPIGQVLAGLVRLLVRTVPALAPQRCVPTGRSAWRDPRPPVLRLLGRSVSRRGPPALAAA